MEICSCFLDFYEIKPAIAIALNQSFLFIKTKETKSKFTFSSHSSLMNFFIKCNFLLEDFAYIPYSFLFDKVHHIRSLLNSLSLSSLRMIRFSAIQPVWIYLSSVMVCWDDCMLNFAGMGYGPHCSTKMRSLWVGVVFMTFTCHLRCVTLILPYSL